MATMRRNSSARFEAKVALAVTLVDRKPANQREG